VNTVRARAASSGWIDRVGGIGAIPFALGLLVAFFSAADYENSAEPVVAYANDDGGSFGGARYSGSRRPCSSSSSSPR